MRWPLGITMGTKTPQEQEQRIRALEDQLGHARGELSYREQLLADGGRDVLDEAYRKQLLAESYRQQAREGWVVMQTFTPFPVKLLKLSERSQHLVLPGPEPVLAFGDRLPPISLSFRTVTLRRGEGYINDDGALVVVL